MTIVRINVLLAACALSCSGLSTQRGAPPSAGQSAKGEILLVVGYLPGPGILDRGDAAIKGHLEHQGYIVTVKGGFDAQTADAQGKLLVIVSSTIDSDSVGKKFRDVTVPVIDDEHAIFDDM